MDLIFASTRWLITKSYIDENTTQESQETSKSFNNNSNGLTIRNDILY